MNRSLAFVTIAAALGLAACTSTPDDTAASTPTFGTALLNLRGQDCHS